MDRNDFIFTFEDGSEAIAHYGVKGMKWGVRKDYGHDGSLLDGMVTKNTPLENKNREWLANNPNAFPKKPSEMSPKKDMLVTNPYRSAGSVDYDMREFFKNASALDPTKPMVTFTSTSNLSDEELKWKRMKNGEFGGATINCATCSVAFDLRLRGYDVYANMGKFEDYWSEIPKYYPNAQLNTGYDNIDEAEKDMEKSGCYEPGANGIITYEYKGMSIGHSIAFYTDKNGKMHYYDCQIGKEVTASEISFKTNNFTYMRLDNTEPDLEYIKSKGCVAPMKHKSDSKSDKGAVENAVSRVARASDTVKTINNAKKSLSSNSRSNSVENVVKDMAARGSGTVKAVKMKQDIKNMLRGDGR